MLSHNLETGFVRFSGFLPHFPYARGVRAHRCVCAHTRICKGAETNPRNLINPLPGVQKRSEAN